MGRDLNDVLREEGEQAVQDCFDGAKPYLNSSAIGVGHNSAHAGLPLAAEVPPCAPFPVSQLGHIIKPAVQALANSAVQAPLPMCASSALAAAALSVQHLARIELPTGQIVPVSQYFLIIAESGERKTSLDDQVLKGVHNYETELEDEFKREKDIFNTNKAAWEIAKASVLAQARKGRMSKEEAREEVRNLGPEPQPPAWAMVTMEEPTVEMMQKVGIYGRGSFGLFSSEGGNFIGGHSMGADKKTSTVAKLNRLWDGAGIERLRAGEEPLIRRDAVFSLCLQIQPEAGQAVINDRVIADLGLLSRLLPTKPDSTIGTRFKKRPTNEQLGSLLEFTTTSMRRIKASSEEDERRTLTFNDDATAAFDLFNENTERKMLPDGEYRPIRGFAAKMAQHAARLAAVLALFENADVSEIDRDHFYRAQKIIEFYATEHLRLQGVAQVESDLVQAQDLLERLKKKWSGNEFQVRDVVAMNINFIRTSRAARDLLEVLREHGLAESITKKGKRGEIESWKLSGVENA